MIKVYYADIALLDNPKVFDDWFVKMNPLRKSKILRCKRELDKKRSLLAGILLMFALEQEGLCYESLVFEEGEHGKPQLKTVKGIHFSLSHAGKYALCCISDEEVGADIEVIEKSIFKDEKADKLELMAKKILSEVEYQIYKAGSLDKKKRLFLKYWTRKESYSKAIGQGLGMDFSKIDTEAMQEQFWSEWLWEDCFASVYTKKENCVGLTIQSVFTLEM